MRLKRALGSGVGLAIGLGVGCVQAQDVVVEKAAAVQLESAVAQPAPVAPPAAPGTPAPGALQGEYENIEKYRAP